MTPALQTALKRFISKTTVLAQHWRRRYPKTGKWLPQSAAAVLALIVAAGSVWLLPYRAAQAELQQLRQQEIGLKQAYQRQFQIAPDVDQIRTRLRQAQRELALLQQQLTGSGEQDAVMSEIDQAGLTRGLRFTLFRPEPGNLHTTVQLRAIGTYQAITRFATDIAQLPRIVVLDPIALEMPAGRDDRSAGLLTLQATATAFRKLHGDPEHPNEATDAT